MNLGRYEVVRELGKGAMGVVYLGKDPLIGRLVALKTIRISAVEDEDTKEFRERFVREAQAAGNLSHPSIVTVHDIGEDDSSGISYIAMEYVEGPNLKEILQQGKQLPFSEIAEAIAQVAEALDYAHSKGIIHRDVKPANIILCGDSRVKITDFGIAKIASSVANLTSTGQFLGTPNYMAPEQIKGTAVDGRTDIFSLGIVLYEALTRRKPFGGDSLTTISYKIVHDTFLPLRDVDSSIPEEFEAMVAKCLEKEPARRYQRARELAVDLRNAVRPAGAPPIELEETLVGAGERIPTVEIPFPEATGEGELASLAAGSTGARRVAAARAAARRRAQVLRRRVPAAMFLGITGVLLGAFAASAWGLWQGRVPVPSVDERREASVAKQRALREDAQKLLREGNVDGAYEKYLQLQQLAPNSPAVKDMLDKVEKIRIANLSIRQRLEQSAQKLEEGRQLMDKKQYAKAIPLFEQAFHLNPNSDEAVNYLRMAREMLALQQMRAGPQVGGGVFPTGQTSRPGSTLLVTVRSPTNDGYVWIRAGNDTIVHEHLWTETQSGRFRRKTARDVQVTRPIPSGNIEIVVALVVPSKGINQQRGIRETFEAGKSYTLVVKLERSKLDIRVARV